ncbi:MAG: hypothetical protein ACLFPR_15860, partial [Desulfococcaceae bacterium]
MKKSGMVFLILCLMLILSQNLSAQEYPKVSGPGINKLIHISPSGEKTEYDLNFPAPEKKIEVIRSEAIESDTLLLSGDSTRSARSASYFKYQIIQDQAANYQQGTVGSELSSPFTITVKDEFGQPAEGVDIVFSVREGGGSFSAGETTLTVTTDSEGSCGARLTLGSETAANAVGWQNAGENLQQVGLNVVDVFPASENANISTFYAYGFPDEPDAIQSVFHSIEEDSGNPNVEKAPVIHYAGRLAVSVLDQYGNPVSNVPVTVSPGPVTVLETCDRPVVNPQPMLIIPREEYCETVNNVCNTQTFYERYIDHDQEVTFSSNHIPYRLVLYSGGISNANYGFEVSSGLLTTSHSFETKAMGNCDGESPPENNIWIHLKRDEFPKYEEGEELITVHYVWLYSIREESEPSPAPCSECTEDLIGTRKFATSGDFQDVMFTFYYADNQEAS